MHKIETANRKEAALYWVAISLIVCEGLPIEEAAQRLDLDPESLRGLLRRREAVCNLIEENLFQ